LLVPGPGIDHLNDLLRSNEPQRKAKTHWAESWDRLLERRLGILAGGVILLFSAIALLAPILSQFVTHYDPTQQDLANVFAAPGRSHWLGTDELGRDTLTRLVFGARVSIGVAGLTVAMALTVGTGVGLLAGFSGGWVDDVLMRIVDMLLAIPAIFLFILMSILLRPNPITMAGIIAFVAWGSVSRLVRSEVLSVKDREFVNATRSIGASDLRLVVRHILPNVLPILLVAASLGVGQVILIEAALDYLGLGIQPPVASWGNMLTNSQIYIYHSFWLVIVPGVAIFLTVLAANVFGNAVRDASDPRLR